MKTNSAGVTTLYLGEGEVVSDLLHPDVVLVGPGSGEVADEPASVPQPEPGQPKATRRSPRRVTESEDADVVVPAP